MNERQSILDNARHNTGMAIGISLIGLTQIAVRVDLENTEVGIYLGMGANGAKRSRVFPREGDD